MVKTIKHRQRSRLTKITIGTSEYLVTCKQNAFTELELAVAKTYHIGGLEDKLVHRLDCAYYDVMRIHRLQSVVHAVYGRGPSRALGYDPRRHAVCGDNGKHHLI